MHMDLEDLPYKIVKASRWNLIKRKIFNEWHDKEQVCLLCGKQLKVHWECHLDEIFTRCCPSEIETKTYSKTPKCMFLCIVKLLMGKYDKEGD